jgi:rubrerythrin
MTKTAAQWWEAVKASPEKFNEWLAKQYRGEVTAAERILALGRRFGATPQQLRVLRVIAGQEETHATWIAGLLAARKLPLPTVEQAGERYWGQAMVGIKDLDTGLAVGAHAEAMRLERIRAICQDPTAPWDVRETFMRILRDEQFHERAFREMATPEAMEATRGAHELGRQALGLSA